MEKKQSDTDPVCGMQMKPESAHGKAELLEEEHHH